MSGCWIFSSGIDENDCPRRFKLCSAWLLSFNIITVDGRNPALAGRCLMFIPWESHLCFISESQFGYPGTRFRNHPPISTIVQPPSIEVVPLRTSPGGWTSCQQGLREGVLEAKAKAVGIGFARSIHGGFQSHGDNPKWLGYNGESHLEMDADWGYPHLWKPPDDNVHETCLVRNISIVKCQQQPGL